MENKNNNINKWHEEIKKYVTDDLILDPKGKEAADKEPGWKEAVEKTDKSRVAFLPVRPDWNEPRKLWGYYNPLTGLFYPTDGLSVLLNAFRDYVEKKNEARKHFIILDEMNLARVEYYMSDLLSLMENMCSAEKDKVSIGETAMVHPLTRCVLSRLPENYEDKYSKYIKKENGEIKWVIKDEKLCQEDCSKCPYMALKEGSKEQDSVNDRMDDFIKAFEPIPPRIAYPENLTIIGTVNVDETTFSFAPKVLDRAFVLEFNEVHVGKYCAKYNINNKKFKNFVIRLKKILQPANLHFGYRVIKEMGDFLQQSGVNNNSLDFLLKSKVLPKIHGTEEQVGEVLKRLMVFCIAGDYDDEKVKKLEEREKWWNKELKEIAQIVLSQRESFSGSGQQGEDTPNTANTEGGPHQSGSEKDANESQTNGSDGGKKKNIKYEDSAKKVLEMYRRLKATGYCSYF
jgi:hypothetical protein